ncbi:MAG: hypothetical protein QM734_05120 [Cyclobacteriaceae bacterium]
MEKIQLGVPGFHNMENAIASILVSMKLGIEDKVIKEAVASFHGVKRADCEFIVRKPNLVI